MHRDDSVDSLKDVLRVKKEVYRESQEVLPRPKFSELALPSDIMCVLHRDEVEYILDKCYDELESGKDPMQQRTALDIIKHLRPNWRESSGE